MTTDQDGHVDAARHRGSVNDDAASRSSWSSPYTERNVSHSVTYTSSGRGRLVNVERILAIGNKVRGGSTIPSHSPCLCVSAFCVFTAFIFVDVIL